MDKKKFNNLERGDIVKHVSEARTFVVTANYGKRVTATATIDMTNPSECELVWKQRPFLSTDKFEKRTPIEINGLIRTCIACPSQWEFFTFDERPVYVRYRWGYLSVRIGPPHAEMLEAYTGIEIIGKRLGDDLDGSIIWDYVEQQLKMITKEYVLSFLDDIHGGCVYDRKMEKFKVK